MHEDLIPDKSMIAIAEFADEGKAKEALGRLADEMRKDAGLAKRLWGFYEPGGWGGLAVGHYLVLVVPERRLDDVQPVLGRSLRGGKNVAYLTTEEMAAIVERAQEKERRLWVELLGRN